MMRWYDKYLQYFEKPYDSVPETVIEEVRRNFKRFETAEPPIASIAIAARNEDTRLFSCLWSLSESVCSYPIEFIGVDNASTDRTGEIYRAAGIKYCREERISCGYARQCGLNLSRGKYFFSIDSDTMYPPRYIETMIKALEKPGIAGVSGAYEFVPDKTRSRLGLKLYQLIRDIHLRILSGKRPELAVRAMIFAYRTEYGKETGYRVDLLRGGDDGVIALGLKRYGKIKFLSGRKVKAVTATNTLAKDGSLFNSFKVRAIKYLKMTTVYFTRKSHYKDEESNLTESFKQNENQM